MGIELLPFSKTLPAKDVDRQENSEKRERFPFLDGFRGICAFLVVLSHASMDVDGGLRTAADTVAVPGFFVLSSFLLNFGLLNQFRKIRSDPIKKTLSQVVCFFIRRIMRVYPAYFLTAMFMYKLEQYDQFCNTFWNIVTLQSAGLCHLWTIPLEMKTYIFMPLAAITVSLHWSGIILWVIILVYTNDNWSQMSDWGSVPRTKEFYISFLEPRLLYAFFPTFLSGFLVAFAYFILAAPIKSIQKRIQQRFFNFFDRAIPLTGGKTIGWAIFRMVDLLFLLVWFKCFVHMLPRYNPQIDDVPVYNKPGFVMAGFILFAALFVPREGSWSLWIFSNDLSVAMGKVSFSWYLIHRFITLPFSRVWFPQFSNSLKPEAILVMSTISFTVSFLTYYVVEDPSIQLGNWMCKKVQFGEREISKPTSKSAKE